MRQASSPCAPAVIYSSGKNNWGTSVDGVAQADSSTTNADEDANEIADYQVSPEIRARSNRRRVRRHRHLDIAVHPLQPHDFRRQATLIELGGPARALTASQRLASNRRHSPITRPSHSMHSEQLSRRHPPRRHFADRLGRLAPAEIAADLRHRPDQSRVGGLAVHLLATRAEVFVHDSLPFQVLLVVNLAYYIHRRATSPGFRVSQLALFLFMPFVAQWSMGNFITGQRRHPVGAAGADRCGVR